jgi:p-aminobenzoyl-glutamate transporter AbgT
MCKLLALDLIIFILVVSAIGSSTAAVLLTPIAAVGLQLSPRMCKPFS